MVLSSNDIQGGGCNAHTKAGDPSRTNTGYIGLIIAGVYGVSCRHVLLVANGISDFYKGERYATALPVKPSSGS